MSQISRRRSKRKISLPDDDDDIIIDYELPRRSLSSQDISGNHIRRKQSQQCELLYEFAAPLDASELAINPRKLKELSEWIRNRHARIGFLLVKGPSGSGKTTAINKAAAQEGFTVSAWTEAEEYYFDERLNKVSEGSEVCSFYKFLEGGSSSRSLECSKPMIIVVDYIPYSVLRNIGEFHRRLSHIIASSSYSLIFCATDLDSCWELSSRRIFPPIFTSEHHITTIAFQPVADTFLIKGINRAVGKLRGCKVSPSVFKKVLGISKGNILTALNSLHFSRDLNGDIVSICPSLEAVLEDDIFHMLGRLLYAKRIDNKPCANNSSLSRENQRPESERDVNEVLQLSNASDSMVSLFLHEHAIKFSPSLAASRRILENMSFSDSLTSRWEVMDKTYQYTSQIHARSSMFYNYGRTETKTGLYKFHLPRWLDVLKEQRSNVRETSDSILTTRIGAELYTLQIPLMKEIRPDLFPEQEEIVSYLSRPMSFSRIAGRSQWKNSRRATRTSREPLSSALPRLSQEILDIEDKFDVEIFDSDDDNNCDNLYDSFDDPVVFSHV